MMRTFALSAVAAMGMMLLPGHIASTSAAPAIAPKIATPDSAVEQVRRRGGGFRGGRSFGGRRFYGGRSFRGSRFYGGRSFRGGRYYAHRRHRHRHGRWWRGGVVIGAGIPFFYGGYGYYGGCSYYRRMWYRTGSRYWRRRYYACRYW